MDMTIKSRVLGRTFDRLAAESGSDAAKDIAGKARTEMTARIEKARARYDRAFNIAKVKDRYRQVFNSRIEEQRR